MAVQKLQSDPVVGQMVQSSMQVASDNRDRELTRWVKQQEGKLRDKELAQERALAEMTEARADDRLKYQTEMQQSQAQDAMKYGMVRNLMNFSLRAQMDAQKDVRMTRFAVDTKAALGKIKHEQRMVGDATKRAEAMAQDFADRVRQAPEDLGALELDHLARRVVGEVSPKAVEALAGRATFQELSRMEQLTAVEALGSALSTLRDQRAAIIGDIEDRLEKTRGGDRERGPGAVERVTGWFLGKPKGDTEERRKALVALLDSKIGGLEAAYQRARRATKYGKAGGLNPSNADAELANTIQSRLLPGIKQGYGVLMGTVGQLLRGTMGGLDPEGLEALIEKLGTMGPGD